MRMTVVSSYHPSVSGLWLDDRSPGPSLPLDYITDYAGGPMFALARSSKVEPGEPGPPKLGPLMKLRKFDRCALDAIIAYRSYSRCLELKLGRKKPNKFCCYISLSNLV